MGTGLAHILKFDEEGRRSVARRGLVGHYLAGLYRVTVRPTASQAWIARARLLNFLWGMDDVSLLVQRLPERYINPVLRAFGATIAENAVVGEGILLTTANKAAYKPLKVGRSAFFGRRIIVDLADEVVFGDYCTIGNDVLLHSHTDMAHSPLVVELYPVAVAPIRIGRGVFIGSGSTVGHGMTIGECSVIGANSAVLRDIPPYCFAAGAPAKVIKELDRSKIPPFDPDEAFIIPEGTT